MAFSGMEKILAQALGEDVSNVAAQEKQVLLSRLLARVAHEIRNPLSSLAIHLQLLDEDVSKAPPAIREKAAARFEIIRGELHRLENIVKHFLSLAGPSALNLELVNISALIQHVCDLLEPEASQRKIEISAELPGDLPHVQGDSVKLTQALVNLVINAIQAIPGSGRIEVSAKAIARENILLIAVSDTGPGVPGESASAIFEPFFTTKSEGSGLGLWVVQQVVSAHGGAVSVSEAPGGGALFLVRLPMRKV
jgi:two-component system sensor histidine kinase HydH